MRFDGFVAIDWSGASGRGYRGIAVARCEAGSTAPQLVQPPGAESRGRWTRSAVFDWLVAEGDRNQRLLVGIDMAVRAARSVRGAAAAVGRNRSPLRSGRRFRRPSLPGGRRAFLAQRQAAGGLDRASAPGRTRLHRARTRASADAAQAHRAEAGRARNAGRRAAAAPVARTAAGALGGVAVRRTRSPRPALGLRRDLPALVHPPGGRRQRQAAPRPIARCGPAGAGQRARRPGALRRSRGRRDRRRGGPAARSRTPGSVASWAGSGTGMDIRCCGSGRSAARGTDFSSDDGSNRDRRRDSCDETPEAPDHARTHASLIHFVQVKQKIDSHRDLLSPPAMSLAAQRHQTQLSQYLNRSVFHVGKRLSRCHQKLMPGTWRR